MNYNGWTNYNTWKINLEFFDGMTYDQFYSTTQEGLVEEMMEMVETYIDNYTSSTLAYSLAMDAIADVDFREIASHYIGEE